MSRTPRVVILGVIAALTFPAGLAVADPTASPTPDPTPTSAPPSPPSSADPDPTPTSAPTPSTTRSTTPATPGPRRQQAAAAATLSLAVRAVRTPVPGRFFQDIGAFGFSGQGAAAGETVSVLFLGQDDRWRVLRTATAGSDGRYTAEAPVGRIGLVRFRATTSSPAAITAAATAATSREVAVTVADAKITIARPKPTVDALVNPVIKGSVSPARAGVAVRLQVKTKGKWRWTESATTAADGSFGVRFTTGTSQLSSYQLRTYYRAANRDRNEISNAGSIRRVRVLNATVARTTAADVAKTYREGCPVGPSELRTISMNYWGFDARMHRGVIIVRTNLVNKIIRSFDAALHAGMPLRRMNNPNVYDGNDPRQMAADNTSGFNCRKVVGNPYAQSPHSYGIAIDVNTVENPYRDANGKWWPANGKKYVDRTPWRRGMLTRSSTLTRQLDREGYFWGGLWSPGRDYQHFEYDR